MQDNKQREAELSLADNMRPLKNALFCPIFAPAPWNAESIPMGSGANFNPRNTQCISACPVFKGFKHLQPD
jgi:hypothetical protein